MSFEHFNDIEDVTSVNGMMYEIKQTIDEHFRNHYDPIDKKEMITMICLRANQSRINVKFENQEKLKNAVSSIKNIVDEANEDVFDVVTEDMEHTSSDKIEFSVSIKALVTDKNGQKDDYRKIGTSSNPAIDKLTDSRYPLHAIQITVNKN